MIDLALPKGSLEEQTMRLFKEADLEVRRGKREYNPKIEDPRIGKVKILRPQEIPKYVEAGYFDIGISGMDWIVESGADVVEVAKLPYSKMTEKTVKIIAAVPEDSDIRKIEDLKEKGRSRITTEYPNITKNFFEGVGIPTDIFFSYGASEAKVPEIMDVVVDLVETGTTLGKNKLKIIGTLMESYTTLLANKESWKDEEKRREIEKIKTLLLGVIDARGRVLITMNIPKDKLSSIVEFLPAMKKPTVSELYGTDYYAVQTVVSKDEINTLIPKLKRYGAEDILELAISKIIR